MIREYTIILEPDLEEGGYTVTVPALPGCVTEGDTIEEAIAMARDAIAGYLESLKIAGERIPDETVSPQIVKVQVAARTPQYERSSSLPCSRQRCPKCFQGEVA